MTAITRHALRVYASLGALKGSGDDVLDALIPFFEPILQLMDKKVFDPRLLAAGVQKMYHWKFTKEIAEKFIPRLVKTGYLKALVGGTDVAYGVIFPTNKTSSDVADDDDDLTEEQWAAIETAREQIQTARVSHPARLWSHERCLDLTPHRAP